MRNLFKFKQPFDFHAAILIYKLKGVCCAQFIIQCGEMKGHVTVPQIPAFCPTAQTVTVCHVTSRHGTLPRRNLSHGKLPYGTLPSSMSWQVTASHITARFLIARHITARHVSSRQYVSPPAAFGNSSKNLFYFLNLCYCTLVVKAYSALVRIVTRGTSHSVKFSQRSWGYDFKRTPDTIHVTFSSLGRKSLSSVASQTGSNVRLCSVV